MYLIVSRLKLLLCKRKHELLEVLALSGGIQTSSRAANIRLIRGDLKNPYVETIDLSTIEGMTKANLQVKNGDIIYVEPIRFALKEAGRDFLPFVSLLTSLTTIIILISQN